MPCVYVFFITPLVQRTRGNYRIDYFGRVVDEQGNGVAGVSVTFRIIYSNGTVKPGMFGRSENFLLVTSVSDTNGDFSISGQYGYVIEVHEVRKGGAKVGLRAVGLSKSDDPGFGVRMDDRSSRVKLPDSPDKRIECKVVPLDYRL